MSNKYPTNANANTPAAIAKPLPAAAFSDWVKFIDAKPKTLETYKKAIKRFCLWLSENGIAAPARTDILTYRDGLRAEYSAATVQCYITALRRFFDWAENAGIYPNIAAGVKGARIGRGFKRDYLSSDNCKLVLAGIDTAGLKGKRDYAIFALMATTGIRTIEAVRANIGDIRTAGDSSVLYICGKGRDDKTEYVKLAPAVNAAIRAYLAARGRADETAPLFAGVSNNGRGGRMTTRALSGAVKNSMRAAGLDSSRLTAHSLRHTAGTLALLAGASVQEVQQLLRHSSINTTMIYSHNIARAENNSELLVAQTLF